MLCMGPRCSDNRPVFYRTSHTQQVSICHSFLFKVPKREIFDRSDFPDFYTIKSLRVGDFGVKIKKILQNIQGFIQGCKVPYAYAQCVFKEVNFLSFGQNIFFSMALLRPLVTVKNNFLKFLIFQVLKKLLKNLTSLCVCSGLYAYAEHTHQELVRKLSIRARNWCAC